MHARTETTLAQRSCRILPEELAWVEKLMFIVETLITQPQVHGKGNFLWFDLSQKTSFYTLCPYFGILQGSQYESLVFLLDSSVRLLI